MRTVARQWADAIDAWVLEDVLAELRLQDLELSRFEDEGGPPEPETFDYVFEEVNGSLFYGVRRRRIGSYTGTSGR